MKTYAGIVLYQPDLERLTENISNISPQVNELLLVDNGSSNIAEVEELAKKTDNITIIKNGENKGIAYALNEIINYGDQNGYEWGLTLDQDSVSDRQLISHYLDFIQAHPDINIGCLTCEIHDRNFESSKLDYGQLDYKEIDYCITSGSFMNIKATKSIGGFDDVMFIDKVDCDICINLRLHNYKIIQIKYPGLLHEVGHAKQINLLVRKWELYNHSSFRRYYMCKNASYLKKKYKNSYVRKMYWKEVFHTIMVLLFEDKKKEKWSAARRGFKDGRKIKAV